jgi:formylglycine-generating enzyme required for sulfatase activity
LPETRAELYMRCIEQLLIEWRRERDQPDVLQQLAIPEFGREALLQLMASLGYEAHSAAERSEAELTQPADLERHTALATIERTLAIYIKGDNREERCEKAASEIINKVARRNGLLLKHSTSVYRFAHRSFQEFLAGYALINRPNAVQQWLQHTQDVHWHEAIQLMIGYVASSGTEIEKPLKLVEHLNRRSGSERVLAGELLRLIGQSRVERYNQSLRDVDSPPVTVWDDTLASLIDLMQTGSPPDAPALLRVQAGRILGHLGDPRPGVCLLPPDMVAITGGTFTRGEGNEEHTVKVATFEIARYLLTNAQWKLFMDAGGYDPNQEWWDAAGRAWLQNKGYTQPRYWNDENFGIARPNHPVVAISWYEGMAFCRWLNGHKGYNPDGYTYTLPSEAEWEYTARRTMRRTYPWGTATPDAEWANFAGTYNGTTAVGCFPEGATPEDGIHDLAGIVWEWTRSYYRDYPHGPSDEQETVESSTSTRYVLRGGGWVNHAHNLRATDHVNFPPEDRYYNVGCRLVRHPAYRASMNIAAPDAK